MTGNVRSTKQKQAIRSVFTTADRPLSPSEVQKLAEDVVPGISIATIYRNLLTLVEEGWLVVVNLPGRSPHYEVAGKHHHHHFHCNSCNRVFELNGCDIAVPQKLPRGFHITGHEFFLYGTCPDCRRGVRA